MKRKKRKKMYALLLAAVLAVSTLSGIMNVSAQESGTTLSTLNGHVDFNKGDAQITIKGNAGQSLAGKTFNIYKLFNAENADGGESIHYTFHNEYQSALQNVVGKKLSKTASKVTEYEAIDYIQSLNNNQVEGAQTEQMVEGSYSEFRYFVEELRDEIVKQGISGDVVNVQSTTGDNKVIISGLEYGYYIVDETTNVSETHSAASLCIVSTANPEADVKVKSDYPSVIKKIQEDDNREEVGNNGWNDIGDYEIGQTVPYKFESSIPNMNGYDTYYYAWHDVMDEALTFHPDSVNITIKDEKASYTLKNTEFKVIENPGHGETFMVEISDIKAIVDREFDQMNDLGENVYGQEVVLTYNAALNDHAALDLGRPGYENDVCLEFSNNPDHSGNGTSGPDETGCTPWDTVVCFTYQIQVTKTNNHDLKLEGAKFRLYSDEDCTNEVYVKETENGYNVINRDSLGGEDHTGGTAPEEAVEMVTDGNGSLIINGVDDGIYYLKETEAPSGYRKLEDPIVITIDASFTEERNDYVKGEGATDNTLKSLEAAAQTKTFLSGILNEKAETLHTEVEAGTVNLTVINSVGSKLPITGSAAALMLFAVGTGLVGFALYRKKEK